MVETTPHEPSAANPLTAAVDRRTLLQAAGGAGALGALGALAGPSAHAVLIPPTATAATDPTAPVGPVLPTVRLTPPVVDVAGLAEHRLDLGGTWDFTRTVPDGFDGDPGDVTSWGPVTIPGVFALQGYERMYRELFVPVAYAHRFVVPRDWAGYRVVLRFESIDGLARFWCNGRLVGENESCFLPVELDVTDAVRLGEENVLAITVERAELTHWGRRDMGAIARPVSLLALSPVNLAQLHVDTHFDDDYEDALMRVRLRIENTTDRPVTGAALRLRLRARDGRRWRLPGVRRPLDLPEVAPGELFEHVVDVEVPRPRHWHPETPALYDLDGTLLVDGEPAMAARRTVGFREIEIDGGQVRMNGREYRLKGVNHHITGPGFDHYPPLGFQQRDIRLHRDANLTYLRPWPVPERGFVDTCNELGMCTSIENPISIMLYNGGFYGDSGNPDDDRGGDFTEEFVAQVARVVETYRSDPSVIVWSLGNECPWWRYFEESAERLSNTDRTRITVFSSDQRIGIGLPHLNTNDDHYPRGGTIDLGDIGRITGGDWERFPADRPIMFTEWCHVHMYNLPEQAYDPGIFDDWGWYAQAHQEHVYRTPQILGGVLFTGTPIRELRQDLDMGFFDIDRRLNDTHWHARKASSPILVDEPGTITDLGGRLLVVPVTNRFQALDLRTVSFTAFQDGRRRPVRVSRTAPGEQRELEIRRDPDGGPVRLTARDREDRLLDEWVVDPDPELPAAPAPVGGDTLAVSGDPAPGGTVTIAGERFSLTVDGGSGQLTEGDVAGQRVLVGGPVMVLNRVGSNTVGRNVPVRDVLGAWQADEVTVTEQGSEVAVRARGAWSVTNAAGVTTQTATGELSLLVRPDGTLRTAYDLTWTAGYAYDIFQHGTALLVDPACAELSWLRDAQWSAYPDDHIGRPLGTTLAGGDPAWAEARESHEPGSGPAPWPWSQDLVDGATRDFRSTKANVRHATVRRPGGAGVAVTADGDRFVHVVPELEGGVAGEGGGEGAVARFRLLPADYWCGGTEGHLMKSVRIRRKIMGPNNPDWLPGVSGSAELRLVAQ